jgi:hypothetical protein
MEDVKIDVIKWILLALQMELKGCPFPLQVVFLNGQMNNSFYVLKGLNPISQRR